MPARNHAPQSRGRPFVKLPELENRRQLGLDFIWCAELAGAFKLGDVERHRVLFDVLRPREALVPVRGHLVEETGGGNFRVLFPEECVGEDTLEDPGDDGR